MIFEKWIDGVNANRQIATNLITRITLNDDLCDSSSK